MHLIVRYDIRMSSQLVLGFYGFSNSGKTTIITDLIKQLTEKGFKVGIIKQTDKSISLDAPGKDTWRHREAGANIVVFSSSIETSYLIPNQLKISQVIEQMNQLQHLDIVLVEGANDPAIPKIRIGSKPLRENTLFTYNDDFNNLFEHVLTMIKGGEK